VSGTHASPSGSRDCLTSGGIGRAAPKASTVRWACCLTAPRCAAACRPCPEAIQLADVVATRGLVLFSLHLG
jgi:hypothetical protein